MDETKDTEIIWYKMVIVRKWFWYIIHFQDLLDLGNDLKGLRAEG